MTTLLSPDDLRLAFETDAGDATLQLIINDADETIIERFGAHEGDEANAGLVTEELYGGGLYLFPSRPAVSIASVTEYEREPWESTDAGVALVADDYMLIHAGRTIKRLITGTTPGRYWAPRIVIEYTPVSQLARRTRVALDLCKLALTYRGLIKQERAGDYQSGGSVTPEAYQKEREILLSELAGAVHFV